MKVYTIENEKLCLNGKPTPLIFGDQEQIEVLRKHEAIMKQLNTAGLLVYPKYAIKVEFKCVCGRHLEFDDDNIDSDDLDGYRFCRRETCRNCEREYVASPGEYSWEYLVQFVGYKPKKED